jgi:hypothetical protein
MKRKMTELETMKAAFKALTRTHEELLESYMELRAEYDKKTAGASESDLIAARVRRIWCGKVYESLAELENDTCARSYAIACARLAFFPVAASLVGLPLCRDSNWVASWCLAATALVATVDSDPEMLKVLEEGFGDCA